MTATASSKRRFAFAGAVLGPVALAWGIVLASCGTASPSSSQPDDGGADDVSDAGPVRCLLCNDATYDGPVPLRVKDTLDLVCGSPDGCHGAGAGGMGIVQGQEFAALINVTSSENPPMKRVLPGNPEQSYVYLKLACEGGIVDSCMPLGNSPQPAIVELFREWIEAGAQPTSL